MIQQEVKELVTELTSADDDEQKCFHYRFFFCFFW